MVDKEQIAKDQIAKEWVNEQIDEIQERIKKLEGNLGVILVGTLGVFTIPFIIGIPIIIIDIIWYYMRQKEIGRLKTDLLILQTKKVGY
jgi:hypothetical protein